jgi:hypothetical protein
VNKEQVYDSEISPLMAEIVAICKREKIAMVASFSIPNGKPEDSDLCCTSALLGDDFYPPEEFKKALKTIRHGDHFSMAVTISETP